MRGFIPHHTHKALADLGIRQKEAKVLEIAISRIARESCVGICWLRRRLELQLPNRLYTSGAYRELIFRRRKRMLKALAARPPG